MRFIFPFFCFFVLFSCSIKKDTRTPEQKKTDQCEQIENQTIGFFAEKMWRDKGLEPIGAGGGGSGIPGKGAKMLSVTFRCYQAVDTTKARKLLIECVQELLTEINATKELESCLSVFPFTEKNVSVSLLFVDKSTGHFYKYPLLASGNMDRGKINYFIERDKNEFLEGSGDETYEEALKVVDYDSN